MIQQIQTKIFRNANNKKSLNQKIQPLLAHYNQAIKCGKVKNLRRKSLEMT